MVEADQTLAHERQPAGLAGSAALRVIAAAAVALAVLGLELFVLLEAPLAELPEYPALILAFILTIVLPGLIVQAAVLPRDADFFVRFAVAPALGMGIMAIPGVVALEAHTDLNSFLVMYAIFASGAAGLSMLALALREESREEPEAATVPGVTTANVFLVALLLIVVGGIVTTPLWASGAIDGDFDDWTYAAYVREFLDTGELNAEEPFIDSGEPVNPRMRSNVWVLSQAMLAQASGLEPVDILFEYQPPLIAAGAVLAAFAFALTLFRNRTIALLAAAFMLGYAFLDLSPHEGFGRNLFIRISEDKMVAQWLLYPAALIFLVNFIRRPGPFAYAGFTLAALGLAFVHPIPLAFVGIIVVALGLVRYIVERSGDELRRMALLLIPIALLSIWPLVQRELLADAVPQIWESTSRFREEYHFVRLGRGLIVGNFHLIMHPLMIVALIVGPLTLLINRRAIGNQMLATLSILALLLLFFPPFSTPLAKIMAPQTLARVHWVVPVETILAYGVWLLVDRFRKSEAPQGLVGRVTRPAALALAPAISVVAILGGALFVQEFYSTVEEDAFYTHVSDSSIVPGLGESVFLGGIDRAFGDQWRLTSDEEALFAYLQSNLPDNSVILTEPRYLSWYVPGMLTRIYPVDPGNMLGEGDRRYVATRFETGELRGQELRAALDRYRVTHVVVREVGNAGQTMTELAGVRYLEEVSPFAIYEVH